MNKNLRSRWQHKAWGASPRSTTETFFQLAERATEASDQKAVGFGFDSRLSPAHAGFELFPASALGLPPWAYAAARYRGLLNLPRPPERPPGLRSGMFAAFEHLSSIYENIFDAD